MGVYNPAHYNKSESTYRLFGNTFYFTGLDEPQKVHGPRWDIFWGNESIELGSTHLKIGHWHLAHLN